VKEEGKADEREDWSRGVLGRRQQLVVVVCRMVRNLP